MKTEVKNLEDILIYHKINYYRIASLHYELKKHFSLYEKLSMIVTICNKNNGGLLLNISPRSFGVLESDRLKQLKKIKKYLKFKILVRLASF